MESTHLYDLGETGYGNSQYLKVEKDSQKYVKDTISALILLFKKDKDALVILDATCITKPANMQPILDIAYNKSRNIDIVDIGAVVINASEQLKSQEMLKKIQEINKTVWEYDKKFKGIKASNEKIANLHNDLPKYKFNEFDYRKKFNVSSQVRDLKSIYTHCFCPYYKLISSTTNPSPSFQRKLSWPREKQISLIESILNEIPIGALYINQCPYDREKKLGEGFDDLLWDGKQRMFAIDAFVKGEFPVMTEFGPLYYQQAMPFFNYKFESTYINVYMSQFDNLDEIIGAYIYINQKQVKHTDEDLEHAKSYLSQKGKIS